MNVGHLVVGLAAKRLAPQVHLGALVVAGEAMDLLLPLFVAVGVEQPLPAPSWPWSHGLLMNVIWSVPALGVTALITGNRRSSIIVGLVVLSHWVLDFISHPMYPEADPDMPLLFAGSPKVGLGL